MPDDTSPSATPQGHRPTSSVADASAPAQSSGLWFGVAAYTLWGVLPPFFLALAPATAWEIVPQRVLWSLVFCALLLTVTRNWSAVARVLRSPRTLLAFALAGLLIYLNWLTYVYATLNGHVVEGALGYFINPIVTILLGVLVLKERLRAIQWVAVGISVVAVVVLTVGYGRLPWISLALAISFGLYGLVKNRVGADVDAVTGLTIETAWLAPIAAVQLGFVASSMGITFANFGVGHALLLASSGVVTAVPLLLFAAAARRLPLSTIGLLQYLAPLLQFMFGVLVMHEAMPLARWVGFGLVWVALCLITVDMIRHRHPVDVA